ncbi:MAG: peptide chain release factor 2, partial [Solirubrobacteraceae bacterium]|nr:peptide chain release factor 2 [Solirubrobacteraceae bacterium]
MASPAVPESIPQRLTAIREQLRMLADYLDPEELGTKVAELEEQMGEPGFWDDNERAAKTGAEHSRLNRRLDTFRSLQTDADDLEGLAELADEDPELAEGLEEQFASVEQRLAELEEQRLFSGRYDAGDALVTVNAGAGGTDAQDWAEMVLRMEMRWAERRGFDVELLEASASSTSEPRSGSSSASSTSPARSAASASRRVKASRRRCARVCSAPV